MADASVPFLDLHFSHDSPRNAVLCTSQGQTMYKIKTPRKIWGRKSSTISRVIPALDDDGDDDDEPQLKDKFGHLARIDWHLIRHTKVAIGGKEFPFESHFKKDGHLNQSVHLLLFFPPSPRAMRLSLTDELHLRHRLFKTRDKTLYKWDLGETGMSPPVVRAHPGFRRTMQGLTAGSCTKSNQLVLSEHPETQIAKFHPSEGPIGKRQPARLEIFEGGKAFADHIVLTFIYVEKLRRDRVRAISGAL